ncbi:MAG: hypothetical protein WAP20_02295 [Limnochordia bacterium]|nr:hypothetical protein [Bacillota bacterium]HOB09227.1 hypothetical protein [Limnochordia bacterium]NLH31309.1 hypothetical protein [Bacillota bacterium]HPZ30062.1 hypothetical protein [Limnochordia bacterium]HQD70046.1 hypothetical protein [Limnochordia bacterium]
MRSRQSVITTAVLTLMVLALAGCDSLPAVTISGVNDGAFYSEAVTPVVEVDPADAELTMTLNGEPYHGEPISENGHYTLTATATFNGKTQSRSVSFSIMLGVANYTLIDDFSSFDGFSRENDAEISHTTDSRYSKGSGGALRVDKAGTDARSMVRLRNYHRNFVQDLTPYNRLGFWVYFPQASLLREDVALQIAFWLPGGAKINYPYPVTEFVDGWNYVEVDLADPEKYFDRSNVDLIEFQVRTADGATAMTYYYDEIAMWWQE